MRVFVVGTGRCGTSTIYQAFKHATNYTAGHESHAGILQHHAYPDNHIEVSSQLVIEIPKLLEEYPNSKWIWLTRNRLDTVRSLASQCPDSMKAYASQWYQFNTFSEDESLAQQQMRYISGMYYDNTQMLIGSLLPNCFRISLEAAKDRWASCWEYVGAVGDFESSLAEWDRSYNPGVARGRDSYITQEEEVDNAEE